jgi:hypothetical protein
MLTVVEFCRKHNACLEGYKWAMDNCTSMQEVWDTCQRRDWMVWVATRPGVLDDKTLRLFAVFCCRQVQHLMKDQRSIDAVGTAEKFANGEATLEELRAARSAAAEAAYAAEAAAAAAAAAAHAAAYAAYAADAHAAAYAAYAADAYAADAYAAHADVAAYAADVAAYAADASTTKQIEYLRQLKPNFE